MKNQQQPEITEAYTRIVAIVLFNGPRSFLIGTPEENSTVFVDMEYIRHTSPSTTARLLERIVEYLLNNRISTIDETLVINPRYEMFMNGPILMVKELPRYFDGWRMPGHSCSADLSALTLIECYDFANICDYIYQKLCHYEYSIIKHCINIQNN